MQYAFGVGHIEHLVSFHDLSTSGGAEVLKALKTQMVRHFLLSQLPEEGMVEALETLAGSSYFTNSRRLPPRQLPVSERIPVKLSAEHVRPVFPMTGE